MELNYADWIYTSIIEDELPWKQATISLSDFLNTYSMHDASWVGAFSDFLQDLSITLAFQIDPYWQKNNISEKTPYVEDWPYLFIRLFDMETIKTWGFDEIKNVGRSLGKMDFYTIEGKKTLDIADNLGGKIQICFTGNVEIILLDKEKNWISL